VPLQAWESLQVAVGRFALPNSTAVMVMAEDMGAVLAAAVQPLTSVPPIHRFSVIPDDAEAAGIASIIA